MSRAAKTGLVNSLKSQAQYPRMNCCIRGFYMISLRSTLIVATTTIVLLLTVALIPGLGPRDWQAYYWQQKIGKADENAAVDLVKQAGRQGDTFVPTLVEVLRDNRELVRKAAVQVLNDRTQQWKLDSSNAGAQKIAQLVSLLRKNLDKLPDDSKQFAANIALRALIWPTDNTVVNELDMIGECEEILRHVPRQSVAARPLNVTPNSMPQLRQEVGTDNLIPVPFPGGNIPTGLVDLPTLSPIYEPPQNIPPSTFSPRDDARPISPILPQPLPSADAEPIDPINQSTSHSANDLADRYGSQSSANAAVANVTEQPLSPPVYTRWFYQLNDKDTRSAQQARNQLAELGFNSQAIEVARRCFHPDATVRRDIANRLPRLSLDLGPWLTILMDDNDVAVRRTVYGIISTSSNKQLNDALRKRLSRETNPELLAQFGQPNS
ncbi:MAG: hypothetical protein ACI9HK_003733 [Pirellulaceae bacterium]|jgi:hypothetical protein